MSFDATKLSAAKLWLISAPSSSAGPDSPRGLTYLAHALYALVPIESESVMRMTCDEYWRIYVNPTWYAEADVPEVGAELAHVTWHLLSDHTNRARSLGVDRASAKAWEKAADMPIAHTLDADELHHAHLPTAKQNRLPEGKSAEAYFARVSGLPTPTDAPGELDSSQGCGSGADGIPRTSEIGRDLDAAGVTELEARSIRERVAIEYRDHASQRGTDPGDALRWVEDVLDPHTPWEQVLRAAIKRAVAWAAGRGDYTYSRPSRRASSVLQVILPGQHRPIPRVSVIIDTSGSVDDELLARALGEVDGVISAIGVAGSSVTVYSVDAAVHATTNLRSAKEAKLIGAGGTDLRIGLDAVQDERPRPDVVLVLTDGDTPWPETPPPSAVVIIGLLGRKQHPLPPTPDWAVRVECVLEDW